MRFVRVPLFGRAALIPLLLTASAGFTAAQSVDDFSPDRVTAGSGGVSLIITGSGFPADAEYSVRWSGAQSRILPAGRQSDTVLTVSIPGDLITQPGSGSMTLVIKKIDGQQQVIGIGSLAIDPPPCAKPLRITTTILPDATIGRPFNAALTAEGCEPFTWSGTPPAGLQLNPVTGGISGTATPPAGTFVFIATVKDKNGQVSSPVSLTVRDACTTPLVITTTTLPDAVIGKPYSAQLVAAGCTPFTWSGAPPGGLKLDTQTGIVSGTPSSPAGRFSFTATVSDSNGSRSGNISLTIIDPSCATPLRVVTTSLPDATIGISYSAQLSAAGCAPFSWSGTPPGGLKLDGQTGAVSGVPLAPAGDFTFLATVKDVSGQSSAPVALTILNNGPCTAPLRITTVELPEAFIGKPYATQLVAAGCTPYTWSGTPPGGLTLDPQTGIISGTPVAPQGDFSFLATVKDSNGQTSGTLKLVISDNSACTTPLKVSTAVLPDAVIGKPYNARLSASGCGPFTWSGTPPGGLRLDGDVVNGIPSGPSGSFSFVATIKDQNSETGTLVKLHIGELCTEPFGITTNALPRGNAGRAYVAALAATCSQVTWTVTGLPAGLNLSPGGIIAGVPGSAGTFQLNATAAAADGSGIAPVSRPLTLIIDNEPPCSVSPEITTTALPSAAAGADYYAAVTAAGCGPFDWGSNDLPKDLEIDPHTGEIKGTYEDPAHSSDVDITVRDRNLKERTSTFKLPSSPRIITGPTVFPSHLEFTGSAGSPIALLQDITIVSNQPGGGFGATVSSTQGWLRARVAGTFAFGAKCGAATSVAGTVPGTLQVGIDTDCLPPPDGKGTSAETGVYEGKIDISLAGRTFPVTVKLTIVRDGPRPSVFPPVLNIVVPSNTTVPVRDLISFTNTGGCAGQPSPCLSWTASGDAPWLAVEPSSGTDENGDIRIAVHRDLLPAQPGLYQGNVTVAVTGGPAVTVPVFVKVVNPTSQPPSTPTDRFGSTIREGSTATLSGGVPFNVPFGASWCATNADEVPWLKIINPCGTDSGTVQYLIDPTKLPAGVTLANTRLVITTTDPVTGVTATHTVVIEVSVEPEVDLELTGYRAIRRDGTGRDFRGVLAVDPTELRDSAGRTQFVTLELQFNPASYPIRVSATPSKAGDRHGADGDPILSAVATTEDGRGWIRSCVPDAAAAIHCDLDFSALGPGEVYKAAIYVQYGSRVQVFEVALVVKNADGVACTPTKLVLGTIGLSGNFAVPVITSTDIQVAVYDNCGAAVLERNQRDPGAASASVTVSLDVEVLGSRFRCVRSLAEVPGSSDSFSGSFTGCPAPNGGTVVTVDAKYGDASARMQLAGQSTNGTPPSLIAVANSVQFPPRPLAPGDILSSFGLKLAKQDEINTAWPSKLAMNKVDMWIGTVPLKMFAGRPLQPAPAGFLTQFDQVNAQIPKGAALEDQSQAIIRINGLYAILSIPVFAAPANPVIFARTVNTEAGPQSSVLFADATHPAPSPPVLLTGTADPGGPVAAGSEIDIFANGLDTDCTAPSATILVGGAEVKAAPQCFDVSSNGTVKIQKLRFKVPEGLRGRVPIQVRNGDVLSDPRVTIDVTR